MFRRPYLFLLLLGMGVGMGVVAAALSGIREMPPALEGPVDFAHEVHPILAEHCYQCHGGGRDRAGFNMDSREAILAGADIGDVVLPGNSAESYMVQLLLGTEDGLQMPPSGPGLSDEEISTLRAWIDQDLPWTLEVDAVEFADSLLEPRRPELPEGDGHPIDRLMAPYYEEHGIEPPEPVSDRAFARRVHYDIIGLPPSPEILEQFEADDHPEKRARLVQSLLQDNQGYAEHWMTFWNDALRNDFQGVGYIDGGRMHITNWLYNALYHNLPYDQFVTQLIVPTTGSEGFVKGIVWRGATNASQLPHMQAAQNVSQVFLGVNMKCASCHDSFTNQWTLEEAYGMASIFSEETLELIRCDSPTGQTSTPSFLFPNLGEIDPNLSRQGRQMQLARLVTDPENGRFARTMVNRLFSVFMGRALVEPLDDLDADPWHSDLLDWLAIDFVDHGYDIRHTIGQILSSEAYQLPVDRLYDAEEPYVFRGPLPRRLSAEQFIDTMSVITGAWGEEPRYHPPHQQEAYADMVRTWRTVNNPLMTALGRPARDQVTLRREKDPTTLQALELTNGETFAQLLERGVESLAEGALAAELNSNGDVVTHIYAHGLGRAPTETEERLAMALINGEEDAADVDSEGADATEVDRDGLADLLWVLSMLPEFQYLY